MKHHHSPAFLASTLALLILNVFQYDGVESFVPGTLTDSRNAAKSFLYNSEDTDGPGEFFMSVRDEKAIKKKREENNPHITKEITTKAETEEVDEAYEKSYKAAQSIIKEDQATVTHSVAANDVDRQILEALELADAAMFFASDSGDEEPEAVAMLKRKSSKKVKKEELKKNILEAEDKILETASFVAKVPEQITSVADETKKRVEGTVETVQSIPGQVQKKVNEVKAVADKTVETVTSIPGQVKAAGDKTVKTVEHTVETVQAIPGQVQKKIDEVKAAADRTKQSVVHTVDEVKAIPGKVQKTAKDVKTTAENTINTVKAIPGKVKAVADKTQKTVEVTVETVQSIPEKVEKTANDAKAVVEEAAEKVELATDIVLGLAAKFEDLIRGTFPKRISANKSSTPRPPQEAPPGLEDEKKSVISVIPKQQQQLSSFNLRPPASLKSNSFDKSNFKEEDVPVIDEKKPSSPSSSFSFKLGTLPKKNTITSHSKTFDGVPENYYENEAVKGANNKSNKPFPFAFGSLPPKSRAGETSAEFDKNAVNVSSKTKKKPSRKDSNGNLRP